MGFGAIGDGDRSYPKTELCRAAGRDVDDARRGVPALIS
jgi:hypothetical protein